MAYKSTPHNFYRRTGRKPVYRNAGIFTGRRPSHVQVTSAIFQLMWGMSPFQKKIRNEWKKVIKRMDKLIAEGYDFDTEEFRNIYTGEIKRSHKQLNRLKELKMDQLRREATSYKGLTDKIQMAELRRKEQWFLRKQRKERRKMLAEEATGAQQILGLERMEKERYFDEQQRKDREEMLERERKDREAYERQQKYKRDLDLKIQNLVNDEETYLGQIYEYAAAHPVKDDRLQNAINLVMEAVVKLEKASDEEKEAVIKFIEDKGELNGWIQHDYVVLFYEIPDDYNKPLLDSISWAGQQNLDLDEYKTDEEGFIDLTNVRPASFETDDFLDDDLPF